MSTHIEVEGHILCIKDIVQARVEQGGMKLGSQVVMGKACTVVQMRDAKYETYLSEAAYAVIATAMLEAGLS